jgi:hypothetical protein
MQEDHSFDKLKFYFMAFYSSGVTVASFVFFFAVSFRQVPEDNAGNVNIILGFLLGTAITSFINYFFGSAMGAARARKEGQQPPPTTTNGPPLNGK